MVTARSDHSVAELDSLYDEYWNFGLKENPRYATYLEDQGMMGSWRTRLNRRGCDEGRHWEQLGRGHP